ncbi:MAG: hypothetical protein HY360_02420 [Verrucomicrobia bacterium]|nr:hypothetical protein [Verrucomicrobiota bacterium]
MGALLESEEAIIRLRSKEKNSLALLQKSTPRFKNGEAPIHHETRPDPGSSILIDLN